MQGVNLADEVKQVMDARTEAGKPVPKSWIVQEIMDGHSPEYGASAWVKTCCLFAVDAAVAARIRAIHKEEAAAAPDAQTVLPGFKRLQKRYLIEREGESTVVPIEDMTVAEIRAKAREHGASAVGHVEHQRELTMYGDMLEERVRATA